MNPGTIAAFGVAAVFALGDWASRAHEAPPVAWRRVEYVCKPATLLALVIAATIMDPAAGAGSMQGWFVAALVFSLAGDVFLMLPSGQFVAGLAAFLVGHLCYIAGMWTDGPALGWFLVAVVVVGATIGTLGRTILPAVRKRERALVAPVAAYMTVIGVMVATAAAGGNPVAAAGAVLFAASDSMIAWDRFVGHFQRAGLWIMVTYHLGQAGLVLSLLR
jgi:uncharacterized membrane protein YhhN